MGGLVDDLDATPHFFIDQTQKRAQLTAGRIDLLRIA